MTDDQEWRARYNAYIRSARWKNLRKDLIKLRAGLCDRCHRFFGEGGLEVHHLTYERLGNERMADLEVVCRRCHKPADQERAVRGEERSSAALGRARYAGWHRKAYGTEPDPSDREAWDRYQEWLRNRG